MLNRKLAILMDRLVLLTALDNYVKKGFEISRAGLIVLKEQDNEVRMLNDNTPMHSRHSKTKGEDEEEGGLGLCISRCREIHLGL